MNIAVFGGSFDPFHKGHLQVIKETIKSLDIDKLFVVPTYLNPFKKSFMIDENERFQKVKEALSGFEKVEVLDYEIKQRRQISTYETINYLKIKYDLDKIYLIIGADNLKSLHKWHNYEELKELVEFVVAKRDGIEVPKEYKSLEVNVDISSTYLRRKMRVEKIVELLDEKKAENIQVFDMRDSDYFVDDVIIATTLSDKHGFALADYLKPLLKELGEKNIHLEQSEDWIVVDIGDMLIHLMSSEYRSKYNLEEFLLGREN